MEIYTKTHEQEFIDVESNLGLTRNEIVKILETGSFFVNNGLYFYTINPDWDEVTFNLMINGKCISSLIYSINNNKILKKYSKSFIFSDKLEENLSLHLEQFNIIKERNNVKDN
jgi:hypothetical protein